MANARRGQAELVAATISIAVFVLVVVFMILSVTSTGYVSTSALAERARFENERQLEKLAYIYDPYSDVCSITNAGTVETEIVRAWIYDEGSLKVDESFRLTLKPGDKLPLGNWSSVVYVVTSRGNVFPIQSRCQELRELSNIPQSGGSAGAPPVTSDEFVTNDKEFVAPNKKGGIICSIKRGGSTTNCFVLYKYNATAWLVNDRTGWMAVPDSSVSISNPDISRDGVNEFIVAINSGNIYYEIANLNQYDKIELNLTFVNITRIDSSTDVIYVYFEYVILLSQQSNSPHPFLLSISVILSNGSTSIEFPASYASYVGSKGGNTVMVVQGSVTIPRNAYQNLMYSLSDGNYNLTLRLYIDHPQGQAQARAVVVRLQALAISGAKIVWRESAYQG